MRFATPGLVVLLASCDASDPDRTKQPIDGGDAEAVVVPFDRMPAEDLPPAIDTATLDCDGDTWVISTEVTGRAASARAVMVRTEGRAQAAEVSLDKATIAEGALWQPFKVEHADPAFACDRNAAAIVVTALDSAGRTLDCVAWGSRAAQVVSGALDERLGDVARGDWSRCLVR